MPRDRRLAVVVAAGAPPNARELASALVEGAKSVGLPFDRFEARPAHVAGRPWEKPTRLLPGNEAHELYQLLHRHAMLVASFGQVYIARNPMHRLVVRRHAATLETFVRYKACFRLVRRSSDIDRALQDFASWQAEPGCYGETDPRVLPFQVFDAGEEWPDLGRPEAAASFGKRFGGGGKLVDASVRDWRRAVRTAYHGHDQLHVALQELPRGMHWEVTAGVGGELFNSREVWRYRGPDDYLNTYPDGHIKGGGGRSRAGKIWPK